MLGEIDKSTIRTGEFNIPLSELDRPTRQKINKGMVEFNTTINQMGIMGISRLLHSTTTEHIFFSSSHESFTKTAHDLDHKTHFKFKRNHTMSALQPQWN